MRRRKKYKELRIAHWMPGGKERAAAFPRHSTGAHQVEVQAARARLLAEYHTLAKRPHLPPIFLLWQSKWQSAAKPPEKICDECQNGRASRPRDISLC
jgi:hypothetical protein